MCVPACSREVFEAWCEDKRNTVIIADFAVAGTLAREILGGVTTILTKQGVRVCRGGGREGRRWGGQERGFQVMVLGEPESLDPAESCWS